MCVIWMEAVHKGKIMVEFLEFMHTSLWTYFGTMFYTIVVMYMLAIVVRSLAGMVNNYHLYEECEKCTESNS